MPSPRKLGFSEVELQELFGHEAAEDEQLARLREYYFKTSTYDQIANDLPLRIVVGHKGIGKSALFQIAIADEKDAGKIPILIRPDDVAGLGADTADFLKTIRSWKTGLNEIIARKVLGEFGAGDDKLLSPLQTYGGLVLRFLDATFRDLAKANTTHAKQLIVDRFLKKNQVSVYIDDLDRGWQGRPEDTTRISALLNAVRDIATESRGINFRVSLRSDVYYLVRTSDESTDKIEGSVIWQTWTNHEIFVLLIKRIERFFNRRVDESALLRIPQRELAQYLEPVMEPIFHGRGLWANTPTYRVLMSLIRKRPRDLVKLCTLAGRRAREKGDSLIRTQHFDAAFDEYSQGRLQDTINEFRSELPAIERLLLSMKPSRREKTGKEGYVYSTDALIKKLNDIREQGQFRFASGETGDSKRLATFMYKINFLTARKETPAGIVRKYFEENRYLSNQFVEFGFDWEIHPAYRWALQPDDLPGLYATLKPTIEEDAVRT